MESKIEEVLELYRSEGAKRQFPHEDFDHLEDDFAEEFKRYVPGEIIRADFITFLSFTCGLSAGGIIQRLEDPLERYRTREWLSKSFFEWFPKYRFLERYDLSEYETLHQEWSMVNALRKKLIELIDLKDKKTCE
ncbi:YxiJ family protein [Saccharibacillus kuerlensis]|uniref:YxiJ-like protein n=1 Tax=Saccharibacillus kuerlensis TaxID=459527 RepID=A0ABQ2L3G4_9BACL|nr:YxiJ family protein [Saccharibacillus kuerlensis]GGO01133.1 hypothetical protein GCM10010969_23110 [Saccharibacillus kuerlensis]